MVSLRQAIVDQVEAIGGRHDSAGVYGGPAGDPGLTGPGSVSWLVNGDLASVLLAGTSAIVIEMLHPSVTAGVEEHSDYRRDPLRRARQTLGFVLATTFGNTEAATRTVDVVRAVHGRVNGVRPDGVAYAAMDPVLIGWVHTAIPWMILRTYERFNRPLTAAQRDAYLAEQAVIGRMGGADTVPESMAELEEYVAAMRPALAVTDQTQGFLDFLFAGPAVGPALPAPLERRRQRFDALAGMSIAPAWARAMTRTDAPGAVRRRVLSPYMAATARTLRWAFAEPPHVVLARQRAGASVAVAAVGR
ncbi:MAG: hypothetical protein QOF76_4315 [Solirubrobacteraceae bacterium]|jgi:uncharacterized protein (DUF2236 family)|nr:hypothetical protein [Solirubrobacteraceae bacterium]